MAWFEILNSTDSVDIYSLMSAANRISGNFLMPIILLTIFFVFVLGFLFSGKPIHRSLLYGSFVCSILSIMMTIMNWLATQYMYFSFTILAASVLWVWFQESPS